MNDPLFVNKLAGALLTALLLFFGLPQLAGALTGGHGGGHHGALKLAYPIDFAVKGGSAAETAPVDLGALLASASAEAGERRAAICKSCHTFEKGGAASAGPNLWDIIERPVASVSGFNYSSALKEFGGAWSYDRLDQYLKNSQGYVPGTAMVQRVPKDGQRADLLAYLASLADNRVAFPPPAPAIEVPAETEAAADTATPEDNAVGAGEH